MAEKSFFYLNLLSVTCKHGDPINIQECFSYFLDQILFLLIHEWMDGEFFSLHSVNSLFTRKERKVEESWLYFHFMGFIWLALQDFFFLYHFISTFCFVCLFEFRTILTFLREMELQGIGDLLKSFHGNPIGGTQIWTLVLWQYLNCVGWRVSFEAIYIINFG